MFHFGKAFRRLDAASPQTRVTRRSASNRRTATFEVILPPIKRSTLGQQFKMRRRNRW